MAVALLLPWFIISLLQSLNHIVVNEFEADAATKDLNCLAVCLSVDAGNLYR